MIFKESVEFRYRSIDHRYLFCFVDVMGCGLVLLVLVHYLDMFTNSCQLIFMEDKKIMVK